MTTEPAKCKYRIRIRINIRVKSSTNTCLLYMETGLTPTLCFYTYGLLKMRHEAKTAYSQNTIQ